MGSNYASLRQCSGLTNIASKAILVRIHAPAGIRKMLKSAVAARKKANPPNHVARAST
jgi:hypothetical protein